MLLLLLLLVVVVVLLLSLLVVVAVVVFAFLVLHLAPPREESGSDAETLPNAFSGVFKAPRRQVIMKILIMIMIIM